MKILLINPIVRPESPPAYFPLGLASVAGTLVSEGHDVEVLDINAYRFSPQEIQQFLKNACYDWLGITGLITEYNQIKWLSTIAKSYHPDKPVVLGGGLASAVPDLILKNSAVDIVVIGEGEQTAADLSKAIKNNLPLEDIRGICFRRHGEIHYTEKRSFIVNLDTLPPVAWDLFPVHIYARGEKLGFEFPVKAINIISGRGCPYHCSYCFHGIFGHKYRARSPQKVVEEILYLKEQYHLDGILFSDDTFTLNRSWVEEFCERLRQSRARIKWACNGRINLMSPELLNLMKQSGCCSIFYGIESGSQKILDGINKGVTVEQASRAIQQSRKAGIDVNGYFIIGSPGETRETISDTVEFCRKNGLKLGLSMATPLPGTKWHEIASAMGKVDDEGSLITKWACWNDSVLVNLSDIPDEELMTLKHDAERLVEASLQQNASLASKFKRWNRFKQRYGVRLLTSKIIYKLFRFLGSDPYIRSKRLAMESAKMWGPIAAEQ